MIEIKNLSYKYKNESDNIFKDINININKGIWSLEGNNGSGKSSFYKILTNKFEDEGEVNSESTIKVDGNIILLDDSINIPGNLKEEDIANYIFYINGIRKINKYKPIYSNKPIGLYSVGERKLAILRIMSY